MYLPQFHPIPENDTWWGKGFTEWTNVTKATPLFGGHYQPHLPADLGFYDLRLQETRIAQAALAKQYGIYGFCYYHYWFNGKQILERPFQEVLNTGKPDFPFMLCWANENWTKTWDGLENNILLKQEYSEQDDIDHIHALIPAFKDSRYIKVEGKPVFAIYRSTHIPDIKNTIKRWRCEAKKNGVQLYLCRMDSFGESGENYLKDGFDAAINFEPFTFNLYKMKERITSSAIQNKMSYWYIKYKLSSKAKRGKLIKKLTSELDYNEYVDFTKRNLDVDYKRYPGITPMWDNTARRQKDYFLFKNATPKKYQEWFEAEIKSFIPYSKDENFIFINAWNEWGEGNHLEPCKKWGLQYLEATKAALENCS
jgi:lipopolysaccharide biosynthesis protein